MMELKEKGKKHPELMSEAQRSFKLWTPSDRPF